MLSEENSTRCCWLSIYRFQRQASGWWIFSRKSTTIANQLLILMLADFTPTLCLNPSQPVFTCVAFSIQRRVDSRLDKTRPAALKTWSCPFFRERDQIVKSKTSVQNSDRWKLVLSASGSFSHFNSLFEAFGFCLRHAICPSVSEQSIKRSSKKRELDELKPN